jgi:hypothetical protein
LTEVREEDFLVLNKIYDSEVNGYFFSFFTERDHGLNHIDHIEIKQALLELQKGEQIIIRKVDLEKRPKEIGFQANYYKLNSSQHFLTWDKPIGLIANETNRYMFTFNNYNAGGYKGPLDLPFKIEIYSNKPNNGDQHRWKTKDVFNNILKIMEKEIIEALSGN